MERFFGYARLLSDPGTVVVNPTVTVYDVGTLDLATIYSDNLSDPSLKSNPFTGDADGFFFFYAADGRYDVRLSGGTPALVAYTHGDVLLGEDHSQLPEYTLSGLPDPSASIPGNLAKVTDGSRGVWMDQGSQWVSLNGGFCNVRDFGALGDGVTDDTAAIQAAFDAATGGIETDFWDLPGSRPRSTTVFFPTGTYNVTGYLDINSRGIVLRGAAIDSAVLSFTTAASGIRYNGTTSDTGFGHALYLQHIMLYGNAVAEVALLLDHTEECTLEDAWIDNFVDTCIEAESAGILHFINAKISRAAVHLDLQNTSSVSFLGCNLYDARTANVKITSTGSGFGGATDISFVGTWIERFAVFVLIDNAAGHVLSSEISVVSSRLITTLPNARVVKLSSSVTSNICRLIPVSFRDTTLYVSNSDYFFEVDLNANTDGNSGLNLLLDNVSFPIGPTTALVTSDHDTTKMVIQHVTGVSVSQYLSGLGTVLGVDAGGTFNYGTGMSLNGGRLTFPSTPNPSTDSNTLDQYKEGGFSPTLGGTISATGQTYQGNFGLYTKIGSQVTCHFSVLMNNNGTINGDLIIGNFPYICHAIGRISVCSIRYANFATNWSNVIGVMVADEDYMVITGTQSPSTTNGTALTSADIAVGAWFIGSITYFTNEIL